MKYVITILTVLLLGSCFSVKKQWSQQKSVNEPPRIVVPFDQVDINGDGNISKTEYIQDASTLDANTPFSSIMGILLGVGVLVGILIFLTTCYKGPTGISKRSD